MATFIIQGGKSLQGDITVRGAKNATTPILAASVLLSGKTTLHNVPRISDVETMLALLTSMGADVHWDAEHSVTVDARTIDPGRLDMSQVAKIRSSMLLVGCLAHRFGTVHMSVPGGCNIGSRPLDAHFDALRSLGFECTSDGNSFTVTRKTEPASEVVMSEFSVTATENVILASVLADRETAITCAAADHVVQDLCWFLSAAGATISGIGTHSLKIRGVKKLKGGSYTIMPDPIETGSLLILAAATHSSIRIRDAAPEFLALELLKLREAGLVYAVSDERMDEGKHYRLASLTTHKTHTLRSLKKVHPMPYPGISADLIQPFALLMTQAQGNSLLHDWMYDGRLRYVTELQKMGANITVLDPHRIVIVGPTPLYGTEITSYDLRAGATLVLAGVVADGETVIHGAEQVDRGYEKLDERLRSLGAAIRRT